MITEAGFSQLLESVFTPEPKLRFSGSLRETGGDVRWSDPLTFVVNQWFFNNYHGTHSGTVVQSLFSVFALAL